MRIFPRCTPSDFFDFSASAIESPSSRTRIAAVKVAISRSAPPRHFIQPQHFISRRQRNPNSGDQFARPQIELFVTFVKIVDVHFSRAASALAAQAASITCRNGSESAIGEAFAMLPPIVPTCRICGAPKISTILWNSGNTDSQASPQWPSNSCATPNSKSPSLLRGLQQAHRLGSDPESSPGYSASY